jgi:hypothetical protein
MSGQTRVKEDEMETLANGGAAGGGIGGRVIASYPTYEEAERAVDLLSDKRFAVERVAIVGRDLQFVEKVTGRMGYGEAALRGALSGSIAGIFIGWLFAIFNWFDPVVASLWLVFHGLWFGALVGALMGVALHAATGGRRDFSSIPAFRAKRYDIVVDDEEAAAEAARLLEEGKASRAGARA